MKFPPIYFCSRNLTLSANYLCFLAKNIQLGLYQNNGFKVLPYLAKNAYQTVYFPGLPYPNSFWSYLSKSANLDFGHSYHHKAEKMAETLVGKFLTSKTQGSKLKSIRTSWLIN